MADRAYKTRGEEANEIEIGKLYELGRAHFGLYGTGGSRNGYCRGAECFLPLVRQKREQRFKPVMLSTQKRVAQDMNTIERTLAPDYSNSRQKINAEGVYR